MDIHKLLRTFRNKLLLENALSAAAIALTLSAAAIFCASLIDHLLVRPSSVVMLSAIGGSVFLISFLLFFFLRRPSAKKVAQRVDALGLQERVSTMLEFQDDPSPIAQLQRQDATEHIQNASPKQMPLQIQKRSWLVCLIGICLAVVMLLLPYDIFAVPPEPLTPEEIQQQMLRELISQLREDTESAELNENLTTSLQDILDQLEEDLKNAEGDLERAAEIQEAIDQLQQQQNQQSTRAKIGKELQKFQLTKALGEGISANNTKNISSALDTLEAALAADTALVVELNETIVSALVASEVSDTDPLYTALAKLTFPLALLDTTAEDFPQELKTVFDEAETAILEALKQQVTAEQQIGQMQEALKAFMRGEQYNPADSQRPDEEPEGEPPEGERPEGENPNEENAENPQGGGSSENAGEQIDTRVEGFYDPISGNVGYGEVFGIYYAEYLKALEDGTVPRYLQEIMDRYFAALD